LRFFRLRKIASRSLLHRKRRTAFDILLFNEVDLTLSGRRALITGAGQGIGRACAEVCASRGADLVLIDKNAVTLEEVRTAISKTGRNVTALHMDLVDFDKVRSGLQDIGSVDILVNNAGFDHPGTMEKVTTVDVESVLRIHVMVPFLLIQRFLPSMKSSGWGRVINIGSIWGLIGAKGEIAYSTAKSGVIGLTKSVAKEAAPYGVTVNAVLPGLIRTPTIERLLAEKFKQMIIKETPLGRWAEPEEVARVVAFLASEDSSFITSAAIPVSGGWGI